MSYSSWSQSYWYTAECTGAPHINKSTLFVHPRKGEAKTFTFEELTATELDRHWVCAHFPDVPDMHLNEVLFFIDAFINDMRRNRYRYDGFKQPVLGARNDKHSSEDGKLVLEWGTSENNRGRST